jgi:hypothetical protein
MTRVKDDFEKTMAKMLDRTNSGGAFARIYPVYQRLQTRRFETQNASEGAPWEKLEPGYAAYKRKRFGGGPTRSGGSWKSYPGAGSKMLIATSTLAGAVIGPGAPFVSEGLRQHRAKFSRTSMEIVVEQSGRNADGDPFDYAGYVNEVRPFMEFSRDSVAEMREELQKFLFKG